MPSNLPLQVLYPAAYDSLVSSLERRGLQPFDAEAEVRTNSDGTCTVRVAYGEEFDKCEEYVTHLRALKQPDEALIRFFTSVSDLCHDALHQAYRDYMRTK